MKVDFHILGVPSGLKGWHQACAIVEQAYKPGQKLLIQTNSREEAEKWDDLLWAYKEDSFLPHGIQDADSPIQISYNQPPQTRGGVLINVSDNVPTGYQSFEQVIEIVFADPDKQQLARHRFKEYRDTGCELQTYKN